MSEFSAIVDVLSEHPDYSTHLAGEVWRASCDGPACGWYSGALPPVTDMRGKGAAERAHREHVAGALVAAGVRMQGPPIIVQMAGPLPGVAHMGSDPARCPLCGAEAHPFGGCPAGPSAAALSMLRRRRSEL